MNTIENEESDDGSPQVKEKHSKGKMIKVSTKYIIFMFYSFVNANKTELYMLYAHMNRTWLNKIHILY